MGSLTFNINFRFLGFSQNIILQKFRRTHNHIRLGSYLVLKTLFLTDFKIVFDVERVDF